MLQKLAYLPVSRAVSVWGDSPIPKWMNALPPSCGGRGANMWPGVSSPDAEQWWRCPGSGVPFKRRFLCFLSLYSSKCLCSSSFSSWVLCSPALLCSALPSPPLPSPHSLSVCLSFFTALDTFLKICSIYPNSLSIAWTLELYVAEGMSDSELGPIFV